MKKIMVFGLGERGRQLIDEYLQYNGRNQIVAVIDNHVSQSHYRDIPVVSPKHIEHFLYDEIWVCTIYYSEIKKQLMEEHGIPEEKIVYMDPVMPILEERLRERYRNVLDGEISVQGDKKAVLDYLKHHRARMYCYPFWDEYFLKENTPVFRDETCGLFYVYYESKRMYFSRIFNTEQKVRSYFNAIFMEQDYRSPHCYWNDEGMKKLSGTGVDVGAAEGIFALKIIEQIDHIYLVEVDKNWIEALQYTFKPYREKVTMISKFASDKDQGNSIRIDSLMEGKTVNFIKMDIEGEEQRALYGCCNVLKNNHIQLAVCVYHRQEDNECIGNMLMQYAYQVRNSEGFVICQGEWELDTDTTDFRRGILFANKEGLRDEVFSNMHTEL